MNLPLTGNSGEILTLRKAPAWPTNLIYRRSASGRRVQPALDLPLNLPVNFNEYLYRLRVTLKLQLR